MNSQMFCRQCQETMAGTGCERVGICGKKPQAAALQDMLVCALVRLSAVTTRLRRERKAVRESTDQLVTESLCMTLTGANYDPERLSGQIRQVNAATEQLRAGVSHAELLPETELPADTLPYAAEQAAKLHEVCENTDPDIRSFRELILYTVKGIAAFSFEAQALGGETAEISVFLQRALSSLTDDSLTGGNLLALAMECGRYAMKAMELLDGAKKAAFGKPVPAEAQAARGNRPGILVAGSSFAVLGQVLRQTADAGVDVYVHDELFAACAYPVLRDMPHFRGVYGRSWWNQKSEFEAFGGPVILSGEPFAPVKKTLEEKLFTVGYTGYPGVRHLAGKPDGVPDLQPVIEEALRSAPPVPQETAPAPAGFGPEAAEQLAKELAPSVLEGTCGKICMLLGEDGRAGLRKYDTDFCRYLPETTQFLAAGSVRHRIPEDMIRAGRVRQAGQTADAWSLIRFASVLRRECGFESFSSLPLIWHLSWYGQRSLAVLMALLYMDIRGVLFGPSMPAFLSASLREVLEGYFGLRLISAPQQDAETLSGVTGGPVRADMIIADIIRQYPSLMQVLAGVGMHCFTCGVAQSETLDQACRVHGLDTVDVMAKLNEHLRAESGAKA